MTTTTLEKPTQAEITRTERTRSTQTFRPNVDIVELEDKLMVRADMPGSSAENVDIEFENGTLTIYGKVNEREAQSQQSIAREYGIGDFLRTFKVGEAIDSERISAEFNDGVLTLHLPKTERVKPRKISVKTA